MEFKVNNEQELCDAMCNNVVPRRVKSKECIDCRRLFDCEGRPIEVTNCVNFEEKGENGYG